MKCNYIYSNKPFLWVVKTLKVSLFENKDVLMVHDKNCISWIQFPVLVDENRSIPVMFPRNRNHREQEGRHGDNMV